MVRPNKPASNANCSRNGYAAANRSQKTNTPVINTRSASVAAQAICTGSSCTKLRPLARPRRVGCAGSMPSVAKSVGGAGPLLDAEAGGGWAVPFMAAASPLDFNASWGGEDKAQYVRRGVAQLQLEVRSDESAYQPRSSIRHHQCSAISNKALLLPSDPYRLQLRPVNYRRMWELTLYPTTRYDTSRCYLPYSF